LNTPTEQPESRPNRRLVLLEIALVFAVFFIQGATPVPEVNEPSYLGKAIHYWNPDRAPGDFFLESADAHAVFYFTFGWLSLFMPPPVLAWFGRVLTWWLLAWSWRRLNYAILRRSWFSILTAVLLVGLIEYFHMAGEWIIGGVEAKGFAFVLVFLGLEALVRHRWNWMWLLFGAASAFHVLVGGWSVVAAAVAWIAAGKDRAPLRKMWPGLLGGFLLSLPGLIPALLLDRGVDAVTVREAYSIYVYERLCHHLSIAQIPRYFVWRFVAMVLVWMVLCRLTVPDAALRRLRAFVAGALLIAAAGLLVTLSALYDPSFCAALLRFYWYRLSDVAVPLGVAVEVAAFVSQRLRTRPGLARISLAAAILLAAVHIGGHVSQRVVPQLPPAFRSYDPRYPVAFYVEWRKACDWIAESGEIPPDARFITPRMTQTFKWYAGRAEVGNWKEIPQDAGTIVQWWQRMNDLHGTGMRDPLLRSSLSRHSRTSLEQLGRKYNADYLITYARPRLPLPVVYPTNEEDRNHAFVIYRLSDDERSTP